MIIARTPYRISFFGGGTDYPVWYEENGGEVLTSTINRYCYLTCRLLPKFFEHRIRLVYSKIETCQSTDEILHPSAREALRFLKFESGIEIHHDGDLPARSGVGSSSAFTVCLLHALHRLRGKDPSKEVLAREAIAIERDILKETVGSQDQVQVAHGGLNHLIFHPDGSFEVKPVIISQERIEDLESHLMLFFTRIPRISSRVADSYVDQLGKKESGLDRIKSMVRDGLGILEGHGPLAEFGNLLHESWTIKSRWSPEVAPAAIREIYQAAREAGALGGKVIGAGGGGFLLLFVEPKYQHLVRDRLQKLVEVSFHMEHEGTRIIYNNEGPPHHFDEAEWQKLQKELAEIRGVKAGG